MGAAGDCQPPGVTADEVEVGLVYPDSGSLARSFNAVRGGVDARIGLENAGDGVYGRQIVYRWRDDEGDPSTNLTVSHELVEQEGVFAVLAASIATSGGAQYLAEAGIPVLGLAVEPVWSEYRNMFTFNYLFAGEGSVDTFGNFMRDQGGTRAMVVRDLSSGATADLFAQQLGASVVAAGIQLDEASIVEFTPGSTSAERVARQMLADGIDTLVGAVTTDSLVEVVAAARQLGVPLKVVLTTQQVNDDALNRHGPALAGMTFFAPYVPFQTQSPALDAYRTAVAKYAPQLGGHPDQTLALSAYVTVDMLVRGLEEAGPCPSRQSFVDGLRAVEDYNAGGLVPSTDFDADFGQLKTCYAFVRVNAAGNGLEVVDPNYCGGRLPG